jgi:serine/threonine protein phosphatase PrpC
MAAVGTYQVQAFACSDVGRVRTSNEDYFLIANLSEGVRIDSERNRTNSLRFASGAYGSLFAVADGMGGAAAGETASRTGLIVLYKEIQEMIRDVRQPDPEVLEEILIDAVATANRRVFEMACADRQLTGMGTTLTAVLELQGRLMIAQIGDSRAYLLRRDGIRQLTRDQSLVAQKVSTGELTEEQARRHPERNILLQALGVRPKVELALRSSAVHPEDVLLLCSDGLHALMSSQEIFDVIVESASPPDACRGLVDLANRRGGPDNVTVVLVQFLF